MKAHEKKQKKQQSTIPKLKNKICYRARMCVCCVCVSVHTNLFFFFIHHTIKDERLFSFLGNN